MINYSNANLLAKHFVKKYMGKAMVYCNTPSTQL